MREPDQPQGVRGAPLPSHGNAHSDAYVWSLSLLYSVFQKTYSYVQRFSGTKDPVANQASVTELREYVPIAKGCGTLHRSTMP